MSTDTDPGIISGFCRMAGEALDEIEQASTEFARVEIRLYWPTDPYDQNGMTCPVETVRSARWVAGEWKEEKYERKETLT